MLKQGSGAKSFLCLRRGLLGIPPAYTAYCASKSAVDGITKALGCRVGDDAGITVTPCPTVFRSGPHRLDVRGHHRAKDVRKAFLVVSPRAASVSRRISPPLLFLASAASDFYTGHILRRRRYTAG